MHIINISVPDMNDSYSTVTLNSIVYRIRFTWNDTAQRWHFGLYTRQREPIAVGIKLVPHFPLNMQVADKRFPVGMFGVQTNQTVIGRNDFINGKAIFSFISGVKT